MAGALLSDSQLREFEEHGAVTLDALGDRHHPLIDGLEAMLDEHAAPPAEGSGPRAMVPMAQRLTTDAFVDWVSSEWLEKVACELLRTEKVQFYQSGSCGCAYPQQPPEDGSYESQGPGQWRSEQFTKGGAHVDTWVGREDWEAAPRRTIVLFWLWLNDVNEDRAPMMFCPGSHLPIAEANSRRGLPLLPHAGNQPYSDGTPGHKIPVDTSALAVSHTPTHHHYMYLISKGGSDQIACGCSHLSRCSPSAGKSLR